MKRIFFVYIAILISAGSHDAIAQFSASGSAGATRIQVNFQSQAPTAAPGGDEYLKQSEATRTQFYESAKKECSILAKVYDTDCKLTDLSINITGSGGGSPTATINGTATYYLTPHPK